MVEPRFLPGEPAMMAGDALVIADTHIGIEHDYFKSGIKLPSRTDSMKDRIDELLKETGAKKLVMMGDVKHKVPGISFQEMREVPGFIRHFSRKVELHIVPGNHDAGISKFAPKEVEVHPGSGFLLDDFFFAHGHAWPSEKFLEAEYLVISHSHPRIEFRDKLGYRFLEQIWVRAKLEKRRVKERFKGAGKLPELILMPAFNPLAGGVAMNRRLGKDELLGPIIKCADIRRADAYLLDGTLLGELGSI